MRQTLPAMLAAAALMLASPAAAQAFSQGSVALIVPYAAGGPTDTIARVVAERMGRALGQAVVVENAPGAAGTIAAARVARARADGHTVGISTWSSHVVSPVIYRLSYDVLRDFEPVAMLTRTPLVLVGAKAVPAADLKALVAWLKARPEPAFLGAAGGTDQVAGYLLQQQAGVRLQTVNYRGLAPAMQDLLASRIDLLFDQPSDALAHIRSGAIKGFAVAAAARIAVLPDLPTVDEAGLPGLHITPWHSLWVPKGTPQPVVARLNAAAMEALADPTVRKRLADVGQEVVAPEQQTAAALAAFYQAEIEKWWPIIRAAGLKPE